MQILKQQQELSLNLSDLVAKVRDCHSTNDECRLRPSRRCCRDPMIGTVSTSEMKSRGLHREAKHVSDASYRQNEQLAVYRLEQN